MKLKNSTLPRISKLKRPNPPTEEMIKKAQFIDKTYIWKHAGVRSGDGRSSK